MSLDRLTELIAAGSPSAPDADEHANGIRDAIKGIFGQRYRADTRYSDRVVYMPGRDAVSFAGLLHEDSPTSGVYGGASLIWFPVEPADDQPATSLLTFVCGTRGLAPDEHILGRAGHARHLQALKRYLSITSGTYVWVKQDPTDLGQPIPRIVRDRFPRYSSVFSRYGNFIYAAAEVPTDLDAARHMVSAFLDFYAWEREWRPLKSASQQVEELKAQLRAHLFPRIDIDQLYALLRQRRFLILQGPPGTGKTRLALEVLSTFFDDKGMAVQFHPAISYENFVSGISPDISKGQLSFDIKHGWLVEAAERAQGNDYLLLIDEINRADLGRVLGEAIYLFEAADISQGKSRTISLPNTRDGTGKAFSLPDTLYVVGTMNSADRSIALLDLAVRRRFAFVDVWPDLDVIRKQGLPLATDAFSRLLDIFAQFASDEALVLIPGHALFIAQSEQELRNRLRFEVMPLLREYLTEGRLGSCETELRAYLDWLEGQLMHAHLAE